MKSKTFEEKLEHSKEILQKLMDPEITLEKSVGLYEEGIEEIKSAQKMIEDAKMKVETIEKQDMEVSE